MQANGEGTSAESFPAGMEVDRNSGESQDRRGKHRILAELKHLEQESRFLEEELKVLERTEKVSAALQQLMNRIENSADPLLPITTGPANTLWDRWFEGLQDSKGCKCWFF